MKLSSKGVAMYLVFCITNYDNGFYIGGVYRSYDKAYKRFRWCEEHTIDPENDSWRLVSVKPEKITADFE